MIWDAHKKARPLGPGSKGRLGKRKLIDAVVVAIFPFQIAGPHVAVPIYRASAIIIIVRIAEIVEHERRAIPIGVAMPAMMAVMVVSGMVIAVIAYVVARIRLALPSVGAVGERLSDMVAWS